VVSASESSPQEPDVKCPRCGGKAFLVQEYENDGYPWRHYFECEQCEFITNDPEPETTEPNG
jgi:hypothetical protein